MWRSDKVVTRTPDIYYRERFDNLADWSGERSL